MMRSLDERIIAWTEAGWSQRKIAAEIGASKSDVARRCQRSPERSLETREAATALCPSLGQSWMSPRTSRSAPPTAGEAARWCPRLPRRRSAITIRRLRSACSPNQRRRSDCARLYSQPCVHEPQPPAICTTCGTVFTVPNMFGPGLNVQMTNIRIGPCPSCGGIGLIPDRFYEFTAHADIFTSWSPNGFVSSRRRSKGTGYTGPAGSDGGAGARIRCRRAGSAPVPAPRRERVLGGLSPCS